jgi:hypothetical protein
MGMSQDSTQNIPQEATRLKKLAKVTARYMEMEQFKDSDHHTGYFYYNCIYFIKPNHCAIVTDEGPDVYDKVERLALRIPSASLITDNKFGTSFSLFWISPGSMK